MKSEMFFQRREGWKRHTISMSTSHCVHFHVTAVCLILTYSFFFSGCSFKKLAVNSLANALTEGSASVYAADDDPELIGEALPFALKTIEVLLQSSPNHRGLLLSAASGFVQYAHGYVLRPAISNEFHDRLTARKGRERAKRLFLRARDYGLRALEVKYPGFKQALFADPFTAVTQMKLEDVSALYWTGAAWGSAISVAKGDMTLVGDVPIVQALLQRALELDEGWDDGAIHEFFIIFASGRNEAEGGGMAQAEMHFNRAMELNEGRSISPLVSYAASVCVKLQDRAQFRTLLTRAIEFDCNQFPEKRLTNILAQRKACDLLKNIDNLFYEQEGALR